jgi:hypothetical protein
MEGLGFGIKCVDNNPVDSQLVGEVRRASQSIAAPKATHAFSTGAAIDGQPRDQDDRHWVPRELLGLLCGSTFSRDVAAGQGVVA